MAFEEREIVQAEGRWAVPVAAALMRLSLQLPSEEARLPEDPPG